MAFVGTGRVWDGRARAALLLTVALGLTQGCGASSSTPSDDSSDDSQGQETAVSRRASDPADGTEGTDGSAESCC